MDWKEIKGAVLKDVPMKRYTSMRVGGPARMLLYPADRTDLLAMVSRLKGLRHSAIVSLAMERTLS